MFASAKARLDEALEAVYREFDAPTPAMIEGCPCCIETRGVDVLLNTPLREITGQQIWRYVSGVFLTIGSETDFRYFLPRILELSAYDPGSANDAEIVIGKLGLANWKGWRQSERFATERFLDAWFAWTAADELAHADDGPIGWQTESLLCGAARAGVSLERWSPTLRSKYAEPLLVGLRERFASGLSSFWDDAPKGRAELASILSDSPSDGPISTATLH